jgi:hypothetical protein
VKIYGVVPASVRKHPRAASPRLRRSPRATGASVARSTWNQRGRTGADGVPPVLGDWGQGPGSRRGRSLPRRILGDATIVSRRGDAAGSSSRRGRRVGSSRRRLRGAVGRARTMRIEVRRDATTLRTIIGSLLLMASVAGCAESVASARARGRLPRRIGRRVFGGGGLERLGRNVGAETRCATSSSGRRVLSGGGVQSARLSQNPPSAALARRQLRDLGSARRLLDALDVPAGPRRLARAPRVTGSPPRGSPAEPSARLR